ncbi:MAG: Maf family protein [Candidatus Acidiferrales bacterium]
MIFEILKPKAKLILASSSPRRGQILKNAKIDFDAYAPHVDERRHPRESARACVLRIAMMKARAAAAHAKQKKHHAIVVGADTVVVAKGQILGKPSDVKDARRMLRMLSGKTHQVLTGLAILNAPNGEEIRHVETTRVRFARLSPKEIDDYIATGEPFDKAGAYGIQGIGGRFVTSVDGCFFNVMGLPLSRLCALLRGAGWPELSS